jgi:hypothetical protein
MDERSILYLSDQAHSSLARAARALGFRPDQVRVIPTDRQARMRSDALRAAVTADEASGLLPLVVVATAGTTAVGAVDPLPELAEICGKHSIWLHVDGAYGAFACLTDRGRAALGGLELADSIALDPHKWLYQPIEVGALLVRDGTKLRRGFAIAPDFLEDAEAADGEVNFSDLGLQLTRSSRAIKLWVSLRTFGLSAFRWSIDRSMDLALHAQAAIEASPELELITPASLGIVTFRRHPEGLDNEATLERINASLAGEIERSGEVFISSARVAGRYVLRLCILNHSTTQRHVDRALELAATLPVDTSVTAPTPTRASYPPLEEGWLGRPELDPEALRSIALFAALDDAQAERVLRTAHEHHAAAGTTVVEQWEISRDLYVVLGGAVAVAVDGNLRGVLGEGDFFGEIAAIEWGAGYARTRTATVTATMPTRLLVLDWVLVNELMKEQPSFGAQLEAASRDRLAAV